MSLSSFGENLKRERELRQISLREIAEATKINLRYLDALEKNEFRHLPGGVFNKGFIRAFAQYIGIDAEAMVEAYLEELLRQEARAQEKEKERGRRTAGEPRRATIPNEAPRSRRVLWVTVAVILLLAIAGAVGVSALLHRRARGRPASPAGAGVSAPEAGSPRESPPAAPLSEGAIRGSSGETGADGTSKLEGIAARIVIDRPVRGSITCDGRLVHSLESLPQGALLDVNCRELLVLDADDAGALRVGVNGAAPVRLGEDGTPLSGRRIAAGGEREPSGGTP
jgi:transcriptional regulator with XRE-family HTH domain